MAGCKSDRGNECSAINVSYGATWVLTPAVVKCYNCVIWGNMGAHYPADLSLPLVTYGLRLEVYDEARPKHLTILVDPVSAG